MRRLTAALVLLTAACGSDRSVDDTVPDLEVEVTVSFDDRAEPVALTPHAGSGLLVGERRTGTIREVTADGELSDPVAHVDVVAASDDQRGLLGLASDDGRLFGSWTRASDGRIVVAELASGSERLVWEGPVSRERSNGGHLDLLPDGRLVIGLGDLLEPDRTTDTDAPNGKLLALDPAGPADQTPAVLSDGWNNPFAFVVTAAGTIWVADNAPGDSPERIGRGDRPAERSDLPGRRAPAALIELSGGRLGLCGYLDGHLVPVDAAADPPDLEEPLASGCRTGAATLADGRIAITDGQQVQILR